MEIRENNLDITLSDKTLEGKWNSEQYKYYFKGSIKSRTANVSVLKKSIVLLLVKLVIHQTEKD